MMIIENKYGIGQSVYLKTDTEQSERIVTAITIRQTGIIYELSYGEKVSSHYDFELTEEVNDLIKVK